MLKISGLHLFPEEFLIDEAVEHSLALIVGKLAEIFAAQQSFVAQRLIPITLQNDVAIHGRNDAGQITSARAAGNAEKAPSSIASTPTATVNFVRFLLIRTAGLC